jgi:hypothetical protein
MMKVRMIRKDKEVLRANNEPSDKMKERWPSGKIKHKKGYGKISKPKGKKGKMLNEIVV